MMTAFAEVPAAVAALRAGAYDYLAKPFEPDDLARVVARAAERWALVGRARLLEAALDAQSGLTGDSPPILAVRRLVERVGPMPVGVLLTGESGTGKEVVARELHRLSGRGRLVAVNCGAIPENLLETELFGAAKGAFSGATADRRGLFEEADGGTLFLDEIGELPLSLQVKLNRALEEGEVRRVGAARARAVDVRVVAATHRDLEGMVADGTFRADLLYRLRVVRVHLPPLRERVADIPSLAARFLQVAAARFRGRPLRLDPDALAALERAPWPGNVRELRHAMEHAAVLAGGDVVTVADLPDELRAGLPAAEAGTYRDAVERARDRAGRDYLQALLRRSGGNVTRAAEEAGVERETLHRLLRRHGLEAGRFRE
jgi:two-component system response regulator HydG